MSISVKLIFKLYTELELLKVAAGTIDPTPKLLGLILGSLESRNLLTRATLMIGRKHVVSDKHF